MVLPYFTCCRTITIPFACNWPEVAALACWGIGSTSVWICNGSIKQKTLFAVVILAINGSIISSWLVWWPPYPRMVLPIIRPSHDCWCWCEDTIPHLVLILCLWGIRWWWTNPFLPSNKTSGLRLELGLDGCSYHTLGLIFVILLPLWMVTFHASWSGNYFYEVCKYELVKSG